MRYETIAWKQEKTTLAGTRQEILQFYVVRSDTLVSLFSRKKKEAYT
jgi:hypothetical protein